MSFAQDRTAHLDLEASLRRALCPEGDAVIYRGRSIHVAGWAKRFLFREEQLDMPVASLSGGERARVLIARLMLETADVLLLDEPTNDLDIPTLEVLEESLLEFPGALVLVSHDRHLLDRVSTVVIGLDGTGEAGLFADYSQWEAWRDEQVPETPVAKERRGPAPATGAQKKLSYIEQRDRAGRERCCAGFSAPSRRRGWRAMLEASGSATPRGGEVAGTTPLRSRGREATGSGPRAGKPCGQ